MTGAKRTFDLFWSLLGLAVLWPLLLLIALAIRLDDGAPVFFRQERVGHRGERFEIWKFRTMRAGPARGKQLTVGRDPRITRTGRWLRVLKLDELPQLFNVLAGDMSLVGPRPEVPKYVAEYSPEQRRVLELVPGITDPASNRYRNESEILGRADDAERMYVEEIMPHKIQINLEYAARATVVSDFVEILRTLHLWPRPRAAPGFHGSADQTEELRTL